MKEHIGTIYLLHFSRPLSHARHYVGWTRDEEVRIERHLNGRGSRLVAAAVEAGITMEVTRRWRGTRKHERFIKDGRRALRLCPRCVPRPGSVRIEGLVEEETRDEG